MNFPALPPSRPGAERAGSAEENPASIPPDLHGVVWGGGVLSPRETRKDFLYPATGREAKTNPSGPTLLFHLFQSKLRAGGLSPLQTFRALQTLPFSLH